LSHSNGIERLLKQGSGTLSRLLFMEGVYGRGIKRGKLNRGRRECPGKILVVTVAKKGKKLNPEKTLTTRTGGVGEKGTWAGWFLFMGLDYDAPGRGIWIAGVREGRLEL